MFLPQLLHRVALRPTASHFHRESFWFAVIRDCWQEVRVTDRANQRLRQALVEVAAMRSEEHTSELQAHCFMSYAVFCLKKIRLTDFAEPFHLTRDWRTLVSYFTRL